MSEIFLPFARFPSSNLPSMCCFRKYPYPSHGRFFLFKPPAPLEVSLKPHTFLLKFWPSRAPTPTEFPLTFHGVGMDIFCNCTMENNNRKLNYKISGQRHLFQLVCKFWKNPYHYSMIIPFNSFQQMVSTPEFCCQLDLSRQNGQCINIVHCCGGFVQKSCAIE